MAKEFILRSKGYSEAMKVGNTIYVSGQVAMDQEGNVVGKGDAAAQADKAYENLKKVLETAGASLTDVVKLNFYFTDMADFPKTGRAFRKYFGDHFPAGTAVQVVNLAFPGLLLEIEAVAVVE